MAGARLPGGDREVAGGVRERREAIRRLAGTKPPRRPSGGPAGHQAAWLPIYPMQASPPGWHAYRRRRGPAWRGEVLARLYCQIAEP